MRNCKTKNILLALILIASLQCSTIAQRRVPQPQPRPAAPPTQAQVVQDPGPAFDSLLAADTYKVYCEVRGVGGLIHSTAVTDLLDPLIKVGKPPKEFETIVKWLNAHAEVLAGSRMMIAGWPSRPTLPTVLVAVEFASVEDAKKFYPELRGFMPTIFPTPTPVPSPSPSATHSPNQIQSVARDSAAVREPGGPGEVPYHMNQSGSLVFISDKAFSLRDLKPKNSKPLEEDENFALARNRFSSESVFLYIDFKSIQKEEEEQRQKWEEEARKRAEAEAANPTPDPTPVPLPSQDPPTVVPVSPADPESTVSPEDPPPSLQTGTPEPTGTLGPVAIGPPPPEPGFDFNLLPLLFFGGLRTGRGWPEAISVGLVFEGDSYIARLFLVNNAEEGGSPIPLMPLFSSGPPMVPAAPNVLPADVDFFATASVDYRQMYDKALPLLLEGQAPPVNVNTSAPSPQSPLALWENKLGLKVKDDLLPLLGNEIAVAFPRNPAAEDSPQKVILSPNAQPTPEPAKANNNPIIAISIKDRDAVSKVIPKLIEAAGLKGANLLAQTEKRGNAEIVSYAGAFSYALIDNFLVVSVDPKQTRHVVDQYLANQTLSSDSRFKNFTRWQSRQLLGQIYVAPAIVEQLTIGNNDKLREFLLRMNPVIDPVTYSLTGEGPGHLHELHMPKNLLQFLIAAASNEVSQEPLQANEAMAQAALRSIYGSELSYRSDDARYGSLDELLAESLITKDLLENHGYRVELNVTKDRFEAFAVPLEYGKTGKLSFFIDESGVLRAGDHAGGTATLADPPWHP
jgi:hypothetical protein